MWRSLKEYYRPKFVSQTFRMLERFDGRAVVLAGGTRLVAEHNTAIEVLLDLSALRLDYIEIRKRRLHIGAMTTLQHLVVDPDIARVSKGILPQAAKRIAPRAIRNRATVGGTLVVGDSLSEVALALLVLNAHLILRVPERIVKSAGEFIAGYSGSPTYRGLIIEVTLPLNPPKIGAAMAEVSRTPQDRPIVNAAALVVRKGEVCRSARLALGGVAPVPIRLSELEAMLAGDRLEEAALEQVAREVANAVNPPSNEHASADYRREMAIVVAVRAIDTGDSMNTCRDR